MKMISYCVSIILFVGLCSSASDAVECTTRGRFANEDTNDCRGFTICLIGGLTNFTQYTIPCPEGSLYSHLEEQCTNATSYKCQPGYNCTAAGNFSDPETKDCSSYVACFETIGGLATARLIDCPLNTLFNSTTGSCLNRGDTICPVISIEVNVAASKDNIPVNKAAEFNIKYSVYILCLISFLQ